MLADVLSCLVIILLELLNWIVCPVKEMSKNVSINIFENPFWKKKKKKKEGETAHEAQVAHQLRNSGLMHLQPSLNII